MSNHAQWLVDLGKATKIPKVEGLVPVRGYRRDKLQPEQVAVMEKAEYYGADAVFFEAPRKGRPPVAQAFVFVSDGPEIDQKFAETHKRLWSWGGVPLIYRKTTGLVQLFRCAHEPDFFSETGELTFYPYDRLYLAAEISNAAWWNAEQLHNGTIWDDTKTCNTLLSSKSAHKGLIDAVKSLNDDLKAEEVLPEHLRRKLLILSLLITYLQERKVFEDDFFGRFLLGASEFFEVLADGEALVTLLDTLEKRFNGNVFKLEEADHKQLRNSSKQLARFADFVGGRKEKGGQLTLWKLYSFKDLPVELISHIYQIFVKDTDTAVYTPPFLVRLMLEEALSWERLDRLDQRNEIILDPCCGSGVFLVEAYKRLVLHWRSRNDWKKPGKTILKNLLKKVHGIDLESGAVELAAFSLSLALCDALEPAEIRASIKLFDPLEGKTLHHSCFFKAKEQNLVKEPIGVVTGNPPFTSSLKPGAERDSYNRYVANHGKLPDTQLAYLFLHEAMEMVAEGGVLCMLQQYNFLYNLQSCDFRRNFITQWDVREILDFISVRGLFKDRADTKVVVVVVEASKPPEGRKILHATFRRSGRVQAEQGFDIDYYDLHWLPRELALDNDSAWRTDLFGGGRALAIVDRLKQFRTLEEYVKAQKWDYGEGFIAGGSGTSLPADHIVGKPLLPPKALTTDGVDASAITVAPDKSYERPRSKKRFSPPMLLIREHMDIPHDMWTKSYLTYTKRIVGFCAPKADTDKLHKMSEWLLNSKDALRAYIALISTCLFTPLATALQANDIFSLPYSTTETLDLSLNEQILVDDIVGHYRDLIRLGEDSTAMKESGQAALSDFNDVFTRQINAIYKKNPLRSCDHQIWPGVICQPFVFGKGKVDWSGADELKEKLKNLLKEQRGESLHITRIARIYDGNFIFLLKPDRLRYWLRSIALRDADETLADLQAQGF